MALIELRNNKAVAIIDTEGAQLVSYKVQGVEVMFDGATNPNSQWKGTAPNLFPNPGPVGKTNEKWGDLKVVKKDLNGEMKDCVEYVHNGGLYYMPQHGFSRYMDYDVQGFSRGGQSLTGNQKIKDEVEVVLSATHNKGTIEYYPGKFKHIVCFKLNEDGSLTYSAYARNDDNKDIIAGMGWHPAFVLHRDSEDYKIVAKNLVADQTCELQEGKLMDVSKYTSAGKSEKFSGIKSADIFLVYKDLKNKIVPYLQMHTNEPNLVLWSRQKTNESQKDFVCIEPWNTTPRQINKLTTQDKTRELAQGEDPAVVLAPGETKEMVVTIKVNEQLIKELVRERVMDGADMEA